MNKKHASTLLAAAAILAGCASADLGDNAQAHPEKQYRTGSNIPRRGDALPDGVQTAGTPGDGSVGIGGSVPRPGAGGR